MGRQIIQIPQDIVAMQEIIWEEDPDVEKISYVRKKVNP